MQFLLLFVLFFTFRFTSSTTYTCNPSVTCGCSRNSATLTKIVGGQSAGEATWGWAVSLYIAGSLCGGSIISSGWILTAAHCVYGQSAGQITVHAGSNDRLVGRQVRSVSRIVVNPSYNARSYENDIALLELSSALDMSSPYVSTLCLPSVDSATLNTGEWPPAGTTVVAIGWGLLRENGRTSSTLQQVTMQAVDKSASTCAPLITNWRVQFCASSPCKDTCQGDSGGPLMAFTSGNQWLLVGIVSSGVGCARPEYAGLYTRAAYYQSWINSTTNSSYVNPSSNTLTSSTTEIDLSAKCLGSFYYPSILLILIQVFLLL